MLALALLLVLSSLVSLSSAQTAINANVNTITSVTSGSWQNFTFTVPSTYVNSSDIVIVARPTYGSTSNPSTAEVDLYVSYTGSALRWQSTNVGADAVIINALQPVASHTGTSDAYSFGGPLPLSAAGSGVLNIGLKVSGGTVGSTAISTSITVTFANRIQFDWTQPFNTYTGNMVMDGVQIFEYPIPFPMGCTNGRTDCTEGHIAFTVTPSNVDSVRRAMMIGSYPSISGSYNIVPYHASTYDRSSDVAWTAGEMITSNDQLCYGTVDGGRCVWRMVVHARYGAMTGYTMRAEIVDITTVVDNASGDHALLTANAAAQTHTIAAAEIQYYVFYATSPSTTFQVNVQSVNPAPGTGGVNADIFVQSSQFTSTIHPDDNGFSWYSALDNLQGLDVVTMTSPATSSTITYWVAVFGQRAGTYTIQLTTVTPTALAVNNYTTVTTAATTGSWKTFSVPVPSTYTTTSDIVIITRPSSGEVDLYVNYHVVGGQSNLQWTSTNVGADAVSINAYNVLSTKIATSDSYSTTAALPVSAAGAGNLVISLYLRGGSTGASLMVSFTNRVQFDWTQPYNTYTGSLPLDGVQVFEYPIPFPMGCTNGRTDCTEGHMTYTLTPSNVDSVRRGTLLGSYPSISGSYNIVPYHTSTYDRSSDVAWTAGEMITSNDQLCYGTVDGGRCVWRMMAWAAYGAMSGYTFRAEIIDITTVVDNASGDHTLLVADAAAKGPRSIMAAEIQYFVYYVTSPSTTMQLSVQSVNPAPGAGGTNVDVFVQNVQYSSLPHPDDNGYSWASTLDTPTGMDVVTMTSPASWSSSPYNVTYWVAVFGQRAGTYNIQLKTVSASPVAATANTNIQTSVAAGSWKTYTYTVPSTYTATSDIVIVARPTYGSTSNPSTAEVDLYVSYVQAAQTTVQWSSSNVGPDAVIINANMASTSKVATTDSYRYGGPLPVSAIGATLYISLWVSGSSGNVDVSLTISANQRIVFDWTKPYNNYTGSLPMDGVQIFEYPIPFPMGCTNGRTDCTEGHMTYTLTPSKIDSVRRGTLLGSYPSISGSSIITPFHPSTYDRSSDVAWTAGEMITSNDQLCYGTVDGGRCVWRMLVWSKYAAMTDYTFRAEIIDITTVVDNASGDHTLLVADAGIQTRAIMAAEIEYYVFYATQPNTTFTLTVQSLNPAPGAGGANADIFVQSILYTSLPHPDDNGYSWASTRDAADGMDSVVLTSPESYNTPYSVTYWVAVFGQRAGTFNIQLRTGNFTGATGDNSSSSSSLSGGAIAGIVIGSFVGAALLLAFCVFLLLGGARGGKMKYGTQDNEASRVESHQTESSVVGDGETGTVELQEA